MANTNHNTELVREIRGQVVQMQLFVRTVLRALENADEESYGCVIAESTAVLEAALDAYHAAMEPIDACLDEAVERKMGVSR